MPGGCSGRIDAADHRQAFPVIDLHSHILPGLDDGSPDMETSLAMARMAREAGTRLIACTPHRLPGRYDTSAGQIEEGVAALRAALADAQIDLRLVVGSDVHVAPDLVDVLTRDPAYRINRTRYFLFEPPHQFAPPNLVALVDRVVRAGFVPVLTHPERLLWVHQRYDLATALNDAGCLIQITANALTGRFGSQARELALRFLADGRVDIIASDGHNLTSRPPRMDEACDLLVRLVGAEEARAMTLLRPAAMLKDETVHPRAGRTPLTLQDVGDDGRRDDPRVQDDGPGLWRRIWGKRQ